jgi:hypothetical protein
MADSVNMTTVTDAEDAGAAEAFTCVWAPSSVEDVAVAAAEGAAASEDSSAFKIAKCAGSTKDFARVLAPRPVNFLFFFGSIIATRVSPVSVKQLSIHCSSQDCIP